MRRAERSPRRFLRAIVPFLRAIRQGHMGWQFVSSTQAQNPKLSTPLVIGATPVGQAHCTVGHTPVLEVPAHGIPGHGEAPGLASPLPEQGVFVLRFWHCSKARI